MYILEEKLFMYMIIYFIFVNLTAFIMFYFDKKKAINLGYRTSEFSLILIHIAGGTIGAIWSMILYRHKTKKISFLIKMFIGLLFQIVIFVLIYKLYIMVIK